MDFIALGAGRRGQRRQGRRWLGTVAGVPVVPERSVEEQVDKKIGKYQRKGWVLWKSMGLCGIHIII